MRNWLQMLRLSPVAWGRLGMLAVLIAAGVGGYCWGRQDARGEVETPASTELATQTASMVGNDSGDYGRRIVAEVYNTPISREELGEYLIARFGAERLEYLVNRKIVEAACQAKGITVSDGEVEAHYKQYVAILGPHAQEKDIQKLLKSKNLTMFELKEDVIRPRLAMQKLVRTTTSFRADEKEVQKGFEARYGPMVQCKMIVIAKDNPKLTQIWDKVRKSDEDFLTEATQQFVPELASRKGDFPPIHMHYPDAEIEKEAFRLKVGDVSPPIKVPDGSHVILRCEKRIDADASKRIENVRMELAEEISERKLLMKAPELFAELQKAANPRIHLVPNRASATAGSMPPIRSATAQAANEPNPTIPATPNPTIPSVTPPSAN